MAEHYGFFKAQGINEFFNKVGLIVEGPGAVHNIALAAAGEIERDTAVTSANGVYYSVICSGGRAPTVEHQNGFSFAAIDVVNIESVDIDLQKITTFPYTILLLYQIFRQIRRYIFLK